MNLTIPTIITPGHITGSILPLSRKVPETKVRLIKNPSQERNWIYNNIITYLRTFGNHQVNATLLYSQEGRNAESSTINASGI